MTLLEVRGLSKSFGGLRAVSDLSFDLREAELLALIGPNGAGKTTCFNMLNGHLKADSGTVKLGGRNIEGKRPRDIWRLGIGRTFQIAATFSSMSVRENVQMALMSHHRRTFDMVRRATRLYRDEAGHLLDLVAMGDHGDRTCAELAYGDLKRLELAIALAHSPSVLLMDEPTAGMAPPERVALMALVDRIVARDKVGILFIEHDMDVVFARAHRVLVLNRGELVAEGTGDEIRSDPLVRDVYLGGGSLFKPDAKIGRPGV